MGFSKLAFLVLLVKGCLSAVDREPRSLTGNEDGQTDAETRALPSQAFVMKIWVFVDKKFTSKFGFGEESIAKVYSIFVEVKKVFSYVSLGTTINPVIMGVKFIEKELPTSAFKDFDEYAYNFPYDANAYVSISYGTFHPSPHSYFTDSTCGYETKTFRLSMIEYSKDDTYTGNVIARMLASNLGVQHGNGIPGPGSTWWSGSAVGKFNKYYSNNQPFCLKLDPYNQF